MIRMNLLPREEKVQHDTGISLPKIGDMVLPVAMVVITLAAIGGTAMAQRMKIQSLNASIAEVDEQARALAPQIARVNLLAQERAELDLRLGIINKLVVRAPTARASRVASSNASSTIRGRFPVSAKVGNASA